MKKEQKRLLSSLREKKRYVLFETISVIPISSTNIKENIIKSYKNLFGEIGLSKAGISFIEYKENKGILKINNKYLDELRASFCMMRKVNKQDILLKTLRISGTLKKVKDLIFTGGES